MKDRATTPRGNRATTPEGLPLREPAAVGAVGSRHASVSPASLDLRRAVHQWLADGKAQGWSSKTHQDREQTMARFCWWLEHEEETAATLGALTPIRIRTFLTYAREPHPEGRCGSDRLSARREARPATIHTYFRVLRALINFCRAEGLLEETPLKNVKAPRVPVDQVQLAVRQQDLAAVLEKLRGSRGRWSPSQSGSVVTHGPTITAWVRMLSSGRLSVAPTSST